jgi:hypothetical protein
VRHGSGTRPAPGNGDDAFAATGMGIAITPWKHSPAAVSARPGAAWHSAAALADGMQAPGSPAPVDGAPPVMPSP